MIERKGKGQKALSRNKRKGSADKDELHLNYKGLIVSSLESNLDPR